MHLCVDGASCDTQYQLAYANSVQVVGLAPGTHTIEASLRNADHSDAGPTDTVSTVTVTGASTGDAGGSSGTAPTPAPSSAPTMTGGTGGYGY